MDKGGDFAFSIAEPDGIGLGNRDAFQPNGYGVTVYPGSPVGESSGQWKFHYRVTSPDGQSPLEGDISYTVSANGSPVPQETPPVCVESGGTATALPATGESPTSATGSVADESSDNILKYALVTIGIVGAAAILLVGLVLRRRLGQRSPRPTAGAAPATASSTSHLGTTSPPDVESRGPLPSSSAPPGFATPPADSDVGESAGYKTDNSKYALLAIAAAAILLIGLIFRRCGGRDQYRAKPGGDDGNDH
jgi:hypothetical protein